MRLEADRWAGDALRLAHRPQREAARDQPRLGVAEDDTLEFAGRARRKARPQARQRIALGGTVDLGEALGAALHLLARLARVDDEAPLGIVEGEMRLLDRRGQRQAGQAEGTGRDEQRGAFFQFRGRAGLRAEERGGGQRVEAGILAGRGGEGDQQSRRQSPGRDRRQGPFQPGRPDASRTPAQTQMTQNAHPSRHEICDARNGLAFASFCYHPGRVERGLTRLRGLGGDGEWRFFFLPPLAVGRAGVGGSAARRHHEERSSGFAAPHPNPPHRKRGEGTRRRRPGGQRDVAAPLPCMHVMRRATKSRCCSAEGGANLSV